MTYYAECKKHAKSIYKANMPKGSPASFFRRQAQVFHRAFKKGRLFERSEFLPFSPREYRSSRKNAALNFLWFFLCFKTKKEH
ncbi:hypothetical protein [Bacteroides bouchesdurhonensis]|uniref:hypothetical protein n=1 Tax=Bacteroides bouchesdurhonensis TaxID=1841855 RepID=UPI0022E8ECD0|nr:hypothetical protein [Bacteroides bouchesdurhonensis]